jgi:hypothetical protein
MAVMTTHRYHTMHIRVMRTIGLITTSINIQVTTHPSQSMDIRVMCQMTLPWGGLDPGQPGPMLNAEKLFCFPMMDQVLLGWRMPPPQPQKKLLEPKEGPTNQLKKQPTRKSRRPKLKMLTSMQTPQPLP